MKQNRSARKAPQARVRQAIAPQKKQLQQAKQRPLAKRSSQPGLPSGLSKYKNRARCIEQDEYIAEVNGSVSFTVTQIPVNPGIQKSPVGVPTSLVQCFPWLSIEASQYEKYFFEKLEFVYKREVSEFATQGTAGKVMMSFDYDANDPPPSAKQAILDTEPHSDCMPSEEMVLKIDCSLGFDNGPKYIRSGGLPLSTDIKNYDIGTLNIATQGQTGAGNVGEIHVRYKIWLLIPVLNSSKLPGPNYSTNSYYDGTALSLTSGVYATDPLLTVQNGLYNGSFSNSAGVFTCLQAGTYRVTWDGDCQASLGMSTNVNQFVVNGVLYNTNNAWVMSAATLTRWHPRIDEVVRLAVGDYFIVSVSVAGGGSLSVLGSIYITQV